jgi:uncharacterized protein with HEPN domain
MRDQLAHRYFDTAHSIVRATVNDDIPALAVVVERLVERLLREKNDVCNAIKPTPSAVP